MEAGRWRSSELSSVAIVELTVGEAGGGIAGDIGSVLVAIFVDRFDALAAIYALWLRPLAPELIPESCDTFVTTDVPVWSGCMGAAGATAAKEEEGLLEANPSPEVRSGENVFLLVDRGVT